MMKSKKELALEYAKSFIGVPYLWGGDHPSAGYDCSGFIQEVLSAVGLDPKGDQTAQALFDLLSASRMTPVIDEASLLFFGVSVYAITHVAIAVDKYYMIEAGGGGSKTKTLQDAIKSSAFVRIRPISNRSDLVAVLDVF